jgi:hypothetical protein
MTNSNHAYFTKQLITQKVLIDGRGGFRARQLVAILVKNGYIPLFTFIELIWTPLIEE